MGLWDTFSNWMAGEDTEAREAEIAQMEAEVASGIRADAVVKAEIQARAEERQETGIIQPDVLGYGSGLDASQSSFFGSFGKVLTNGLASIGSALGSFLGQEGVGDPDPGSVGETVAAGLDAGEKILEKAGELSGGISNKIIYTAGAVLVIVLLMRG